MKYPLALHQKLESVRGVISEWRIDVDFDHVMKWILQFDPADYGLALAVIKNLNVIGPDDLNSSLSVAYSKLMRKAVERDAKITSRNTLFAGVGTAGKSGAMLGYQFRLANEISEENFLDAETEHYIEQGHIENLVLVDDVIATGRQASREIQELSAKVTPLGVKNIFLLTICGFRAGIDLVERETKAYTFSAHEYGPEDTAVSFDSSLYDGVGHDERASRKQRLLDYGSICAPKSPLGYGGLGAFIVPYYNTPNCTLPIVWSEQNDWIPLFRRVRRINGIASYYRQFDKALDARTASEAKAPIPETANRAPQDVTVTLLVEGKTEELFFDLLASRRDLSNLIGVKKVSVVALGGIYGSPRLLQLVARTSHPAVLVLDSDPHTRSVYSKNPDTFRRIPCVFLPPNIFGLTRLMDIYLDEEFEGILPPLPPEPVAPSDEAYFITERELGKRLSASKRQALLRRIVEMYIDDDALHAFVAELKRALIAELQSTDSVTAHDGTELR